MSVQVRKFELDPSKGAMAPMGIFHIEMPEYAQIIHVGLTGNQVHPCIWAICDSDNDEVTHTFAVKMTGENMEDLLTSGPPKHLATFLHLGTEVWHLFEIE